VALLRQPRLSLDILLIVFSKLRCFFKLDPRNLMHDHPHHLARRRITYLLRRALGDLFFRCPQTELQLDG
jgi:hypothetical protein